MKKSLLTLANEYGISRFTFTIMISSFKNQIAECGHGTGFYYLTPKQQQLIYDMLGNPHRTQCKFRYQIANEYGISVVTLSKLINDFEDELMELRTDKFLKLFNPKQVMLIYDKLGKPD